MATPYVPVPMPIGNSSSSFTTNRNQRSSSFGSISTNSNSSKGQLEESNMGNLKQTSVPDLMDGSPLVRTKFTNANSSIEYSTRPRESEEQNSETVNLEDRPSTPTILGYEVMEERAKFTLKEMFPGFRLALPPKRWFKDNYNADFLEDRQLGLQAFLQNLVAHKDIAQCLAVREFLCLDDPPGPFDSLEESRAFCETLEETNYRFQKELFEKQKEVESLKKLLSEKQLHIEMLEKRIRALCLEPEESLHLSGTEGEQIPKADAPVLQFGQEFLDEESRADDKSCLSFSEPENSVLEVEVAEVAYHAEED
ncbi:sorting nexin 16 [Phyllostomus discolor]|uniref:Sorting nexin 16 n=1 Tax=Phyllostomus discolor TaxID=89673 RepID=A0A834DYN2_9CHIR|nr:sorting nexin 16 [Phyllostomus discolor]